MLAAQPSSTCLKGAAGDLTFNKGTNKMDKEFIVPAI